MTSKDLARFIGNLLLALALIVMLGLYLVKRRMNVKLFLVLVVLAIVAALFVLPYLYELLGPLLEEARLELGVGEAVFNIILIVQTVVMYTVAALVGVLLYRRAGYHMPLLERLTGADPGPDSPQPRLPIAAAVGAGLAVLLIAGDYLFFRLGSPLSLFESDL